MSAARQPRALVQVDGSTRIDLISFDTHENEFSQPDTFSFTTAISALPADHAEDWWAASEAVDIEIFAGSPADSTSFSTADLSSRFVGKVDEVTLDWGERTMTVTGRDLTQPLVDTKASEKYVNQTASDVATTLAGKYGLTPVVTATTEKVGKFYQVDHVDLKEERTEWDLITWLARESGFRVYVKRRELHFEPLPAPGSGTPFLIKRIGAGSGVTESGNYVALRTQRTLTVSGDITVTVRSWNAKKKRPFTAVAKRSGKAKGLLKGGGSQRKQEYSYTIPGLDLDGAQKRANQLLEELSKHAMKMGFSGPAEDGLDMAGIIRLEGTSTAFDQVYYPQSISREFSIEDGDNWSVEAKNAPTESEPTL